MELLLSAFLGFMIITILDRKWFEIDHKRIEQGYEVLEHYHLGIGLIGIGIGIIAYLPLVSYGLIGAGMGLIYHESKQKNYFAIQSAHFRNSSIIGVILIIITITIYFL